MDAERDAMHSSVWKSTVGGHNKQLQSTISNSNTNNNGNTNKTIRITATHNQHPTINNQ